MKRKILLKKLAITLFLLGLNFSFGQAVDFFNATATPPKLARYDADVRGDILVIGNSIIGRSRTNNNVDGNGDPTGPIDNPNNTFNLPQRNNNTWMRYIDIDGDPSTFSSSNASLILPNVCAQVVYAALYWGALYKEVDRTQNRNIKFKKDAGLYQNIVGTLIIDQPAFVNPPTKTSDGSPYAYFADVTNIVNGNGTYTVADMKAIWNNEDRATGNGLSAGWSLFVVYSDITLPTKSISLYDGYQQIGGTSSVTIPVSGFRTIPVGPVRGKIAFGTLEGDQRLEGETIKINTIEQISTTRPYTNFQPPTNVFKPNFFNATINNLNSQFLNRVPASTNTFGYDTGVINMINNTGLTQNTAIANNATTADINMASTGDFFGLFFTALSLETIAPKIEVFKQTYNPINGALVTGGVNLGDVVEYVLNVKNVGNEDATSLTVEDSLPENIDLVYVSGVPQIQLPAPIGGQSITFVITLSPSGAQKITFTIPRVFVPKNSISFPIRIRVKVIDSCEELRDACEDYLRNTALSTYSSPLAIPAGSLIAINQPSVNDVDVCGNTVPGSTNFITNRNSCSYNYTLQQCGLDAVTITAPNNYTYSWQGPPGGVPAGYTAQVLNATLPGVYTITCQAPNPCVSITVVYEVLPFDPLRSNPFGYFNASNNPIITNSAVNVLTQCPGDNSLVLAKLFLCGINDTRLIQTGINNATSIVWQKLDTSCSVVVNPDCPNVSAACTWNNVGTANSPDFDVITAGSYRLIVTYQNGCRGTYYFDVFKNNFSATYKSNDFICNTDARIEVLGVPTGYQFSLVGPTGPWQNSPIFNAGSLPNQITNIGVYTVYISQIGVTNNPCIFRLEDIVIRRRNFTADAIPTNPLCSTGKGSIRIVSNDVNGPYTYSIVNAIGTPAYTQTQTTALNIHDFISLNTGTYIVSVSTQDGCLYTETLSVTIPTAVTLSAAITKPLTCTPGQVSLIAGGGSPDYNFTFSGLPGVTTPIPTFQVDAPGTYTAIVTDNNGCSASATIIVSQLDTPTITITPTNLLCFGVPTGQLVFDYVPGNFTILFDLNDGASPQTDTLTTGLYAGTYNVTVLFTLDGITFCSYDQTVTITEPDQLDGLAVLVPQTTCTPNATINIVNVTGGDSLTYSYTIDSGVTTQTSPTFLNVAPGTYNPRILDGNGCYYDTNPITVPAFTPPIDLTFAYNAITCYSPTTSVQLTTTGGSGTLTYSVISPTSIINPPNVNTFTLGAGTYVFEVKDNIGCTYTEPLTINPVVPILATGIPTNNVICFGTNTGNGVVNVSGYSGVYSYQVNALPVVTNQSASVINLNNLAAGTYNIRVTDSQTGCFSNTSFIIEGPTAQLDATHVAQPITCSNPGSVVISVVGGWGSNVFTLTTPSGPRPPQSNGTFLLLTDSGTYTYSVRDLNGCTDTGTFNLTTPILPIATVSAASNLCYKAGSPSTIIVTASGGVGPYEFSLNGAAYTSSGTFGSLTPGTYCINVRDSFGCISDTPVCRTIAPELVANAVLVNGLNCKTPPDGPNALIRVNITNGNPLYTAEVTNNGGTTYTAIPTFTGTTFDYSSAVAGTYRFRITDTLGCVTLSNPINVVPLIPVTVSATPLALVRCFGDSNGSITVTPGGGIGNYVLNIFNTTNGVDYGINTTGLPAGTYSITATDSNNCKSFATVVIAQPDSVTFDISTVQLSCGPLGTTPGSITVSNVNGGAGAFTYVLTGNTISPITYNAIANENHTFSNLSFGEYIVTVTNANGCIAFKDKITIASTVTDILNVNAPIVNCALGAEILASVNPLFVGGPYHFAIYQSQPGNIPPLPPHNYFDILDLSNPTAQGYYDEDVPGGKSHNFTGLMPDTFYTIIVFDESTGCYFFKTITTPTSSNSGLVITGTPKNVACVGANDGSVSFSFSGMLSNSVEYGIYSSPNNTLVAGTLVTGFPTTGSTTFTVSNVGVLAPGNYFVSIIEEGGVNNRCGKIFSFTITQSTTLPTIGITTDNDNCGLNKGVISAVGNGGTGPYNYMSLVTGTLPAPTQTTFVLGNTNGVFNLENGAYDIYIMDANGCVQTTPANVGLDVSPTITAAQLGTTTCNSVQGNYTIRTTRSNGIAPFTYSIDGGSFQSYVENGLQQVDFSNFNSGTHIIVVKDDNGCTDTQTVVITPPVSGSASAAILATANCNLNVADITVNAIGGSGTYLYSINTIPAIDSQTSNVFTSVNANTTPYVVTITDSVTGCLATTTVSVALGVPVALTIGNVGVTNVSCFGLSDGQIVVTLPASNTQGPYVYTLTSTLPFITQTNTTGIFNTNIVAGNYNILVTSSRGCVNNVNFPVNQNPSVFVNASVTTPFACNASNTPTVAQITAVGGGGTGTYNYSINNGLSYFSSGIFNIIDTSTVQIIIVTVKDSNNCTATQSVVVNPLPKMDTPTANETTVLSCAQPGVITVAVTGGSGNYTIQLLPSGVAIPSTGSANFPLITAGAYSFLITDTATGCTRNVSYTKPIYDTLQATASTTNNLLCFGDTNGAIAVNITGYTGTYNWEVKTSTGASLAPVPGGIYSGTGNTTLPLAITGLPAGSYVVSIVETAYPFCTYTSTATTIATPNAPVTATISTTPVNCNNNSGGIQVTGLGGTGVLQYQILGVAPSTYSQTWSTDATANGLSTGDYTVQVRDANGCTTAIIPVNLPAPVQITYTSIVPSPILLNCIGFCNASVTVNGVANGFGSNYNYTLNNITLGSSSGPQQLPTFSNLCAGTYSITITDPWFCSITTDTVTISEPTQDIVGTLSNPVTLSCAANAQLTLSVTGGTGPYSYSTSPTGTFIAISPITNTVTGISVPCGSYTYYVRDNNLCKVKDSNTIIIDCIDPLVLTLDTAASFVKCAADNTASVFVTAAGGLGGYTYTLYNSATNAIVTTTTQNPITATTASFGNLGTGNYYIIGTGTGGCASVQYPFIVTAPLALTATAVGNPTSCAGLVDGSITVSPSGGIAPYQYIIVSNNASQTFDKTPITSLPQGCYSITVQDANNCTFLINSVCILDPTPITFVTSPQGVYSEVCLGDTVNVSFEVTGGREYSPTSSYTLVITNPVSNFNQTYNSPTGQFNFPLVGSVSDYSLTVYGPNANCNNNFNIQVVPGINFTPIPTLQTFCNPITGVAYDEWVITVDGNSYNAPLSDFTFQIDSGSFSSQNTFSNLSAGPHVVNVRYLNGCSKSVTINFNTFTPLNLTVAEVGLNQFNVTTTGGTPSYSYTVNGNSYDFTTPYLINQTGNYLVEVTDQNGCVDSQLFYIKFYDIVVPNFFTPNGDNNNSTWMPLYTDNFPNISYEIYDRYGRKLIVLTYGQGWDGKYESLDMPSGDYWYIIKLNSPNDNREFVGNFTLYR
jgi:large repetitive protein